MMKYTFLLALILSLLLCGCNQTTPQPSDPTTVPPTTAPVTEPFTEPAPTEPAAPPLSVFTFYATGDGTTLNLHSACFDMDKNSDDPGNWTDVTCTGVCHGEAHGEHGLEQYRFSCVDPESIYRHLKGKIDPTAPEDVYQSYLWMVMQDNKTLLRYWYADDRLYVMNEEVTFCPECETAFPALE